MVTAQEDAQAIADALAAAHDEHPGSTSLDALHSALLTGLENHGDTLDLDKEALLGTLAAQRGGEPKPEK